MLGIPSIILEFFSQASRKLYFMIMLSTQILVLITLIIEKPTQLIVSK